MVHTANNAPTSQERGKFMLSLAMESFPRILQSVPRMERVVKILPYKVHVVAKRGFWVQIVNIGTATTFGTT